MHTATLSAKAAFIATLEAGRPQIIVTYGTSLTAGGAWVGHLQQALDNRFPGWATVINSGCGGMWSQWGVENLDERVLAKKPDVVIIEFSINDAFLEYKMTPDAARRNLETMIDRILGQNSGCEIILMVMNPPTGTSLEKRPQITDFEEVYRDTARIRGLRLIDHSPNWNAILNDDSARWTEYVPDGIHPNALGSEKVTTPFLLQSIGLGGA